MKKSIFVGILLILSVVLITATQGLAADFLNFTESYEQTFVCNWNDWELKCGVIGSGEFSVAGCVSLNGMNIKRQFNRSTPFYILVGGLSFWGVLGDDPDYAAGHKSATFVFLNSDGRRDLKYLTVVFRWDTKNLTVAINGKTPTFFDPLMATAFLGAETGPIDDTAFAHFELGGTISLDFMVDVTGNVATETISPEGQELALSKINLKGVGSRIDQRPM